MRPAPAVFLLVCLGLGLLGGIQHFADIPQSDGPAPLLLTERREVMVARPRSVVTTPAQAPSKSQPSISWRSLESRDFKQLIRNLRAVECPEPTIRDIVFQRVNLHFAEREGLVRFKLAGPAKDWASRPPLTDEEIESLTKAGQLPPFPPPPIIDDTDLFSDSYEIKYEEELIAIENIFAEEFIILFYVDLLRYNNDTASFLPYSRLPLRPSPSILYPVYLLKEIMLKDPKIRESMGVWLQQAYQYHKQTLDRMDEISKEMKISL